MKSEVLLNAHVTPEHRKGMKGHPPSRTVREGSRYGKNPGRTKKGCKVSGCMQLGRVGKSYFVTSEHQSNGEGKSVPDISEFLQQHLTGDLESWKQRATRHA